jgi:S-adenosylmethionine:tRNA ribosyltransferase-isomerase
MKTSEFDYDLPPELIAQTPAEPRDHSQLLVLHRASGNIEHRHFYDLPEYLKEGDVLVFNDSRVIPARLFGFIEVTGARIELLLLRRLKDNTWEAMAKPGKKLKNGSALQLVDSNGGHPGGLTATIVDRRDDGIRIITLSDEILIDSYGHTPLPPYIKTPLDRPERYQTVYSRIKGSAAAPTAGLHFTPGLLDELREKKVGLAFVTLHIGLDTFQPVREEDPARHKIHTEYGELGTETAELINKARKDKKRVIPVGTSSMRIVEAASQSGTAVPFRGDISLFIMPGYTFKAADAMITNFHLPRSTLVMLVSAFAGRERILSTYKTAMESGYRFYSFGDAMLIL